MIGTHRKDASGTVYAVKDRRFAEIATNKHETQWWLEIVSTGTQTPFQAGRGMWLSTDVVMEHSEEFHRDSE